MEYKEGPLRKSIKMYSELEMKYIFFLHMGGKSVNNPHGANTTKELLCSYEEFCNFISLNNLSGLYRDMIRKFGEDLKTTLNSALKPADWDSSKQLLGALEEKLNAASAVG